MTAVVSGSRGGGERGRVSAGRVRLRFGIQHDPRYDRRCVVRGFRSGLGSGPRRRFGPGLRRGAERASGGSDGQGGDDGVGLGDHARDRCLAALGFYRDHPDPEGEASALDTLGYIAHRTGAHQEAIRHHRQVLALSRDLGHTCNVVYTLDELGHPYAALGRRDQARAVWREASRVYRAQGHDAAADRVRRQLDALDAR